MSNQQRVIAVIQARMSSSRLPGKSMKDVGGIPMLGRLINQVRGAHSLDGFIIATSTGPEDDEIENYCNFNDLLVVRGSRDNVLSRYVLAAEVTDADVIVRLTGDCPLHSPDTIDEVVNAYLGAGVDYACNTNPYTRPDGQDVEVFSRQVLRQALENAEFESDREHVTPWIRRSSELRRLDFFHAPPHLRSARWSVDHPDDLEFVRSVWSVLDHGGPGPFDFEEIMSAVKESNAPQGKSIINEGFYLSLLNEATAEAAAPLDLDESFRWLERSDQVIPGGAQTYSKSWRHHIRGVTPIFLRSGKGAMVKDVDGNEYVDLIQGLLPNILGYADDDVNEAAAKQAQSGHSFSLAHPIEVELAERLCRIIPCADMVRFGKNGSDATAGAVRIARAYTGREHVAVCGYHGWQDWFIGTTSRNAGVPKGVQELAHTFPYGDAQALDALLSSRKDQFAAVIMEPVNFNWPEASYLESIKQIAHKHGALLIFDEICSGFHFGLGGAQKIFGVTPDLATFGKAMGNGWPISCVVGRRDVMKVFEDAFMSFTFAGDVSAMAASMKVLDILESGDAYARMTAAGTKLFDGAKVMADRLGLGERFQIKGHPHWSTFSFVDENGKDDAAARALWLQELTRRGVLVLTTFNISSALDENTVTKVLSGFAHAFKRVALAQEQGISPAEWVDGPLPIPAFRAR
ncbi:aminotransferase class III-fold pyridoxal phosphate-dependent enzyme [Thalassospira indica]|uniref:Aminotransferase class III-fold pyridoxal phosphate-dependent enzyme n=1 Tax=Thalassospira indica TaxID=1891279 RepID=A0ABN5NE26_9PROT|nr:aminotransferase class III-fold pyridoxal phosphate-dependent enzyme [Thalassospira indica]AXO13648.1 aminotransferase class III-fold pyridoxal phosphate-dependent enzyme [Thalassospira indica]